MRERKTTQRREERSNPWSKDYRPIVEAFFFGSSVRGATLSIFPGQIHIGDRFTDAETGRPREDHGSADDGGHEPA